MWHQRALLLLLMRSRLCTHTFARLSLFSPYLTWYMVLGIEVYYSSTIKCLRFDNAIAIWLYIRSPLEYMVDFCMFMDKCSIKSASLYFVQRLYNHFGACSNKLHVFITIDAVWNVLKCNVYSFNHFKIAICIVKTESQSLYH